MDSLDLFIKNGGFIAEPEAIIVKEILLYGEMETLDELSHALDSALVSYDSTTEPEIQDGINYHWIGALSKDDEENLLLCLSAKRKNSNIRTIAKCNNAIYENVFRQTGITVILNRDLSINQILTCLRG